MQQKADAAAAAHEKALADARANAQALAQAARDQLAAEADAKRKALDDGARREARRGGDARSRRRAPRRWPMSRAIARDAAGAIVERLIGRPRRPGGGRRRGRLAAKPN